MSEAKFVAKRLRLLPEQDGKERKDQEGEQKWQPSDRFSAGIVDPLLPFLDVATLIALRGASRNARQVAQQELEQRPATEKCFLSTHGGTDCLRQRALLEVEENICHKFCRQTVKELVQDIGSAVQSTKTKDMNSWWFLRDAKTRVLVDRAPFVHATLTFINLPIVNGVPQKEESWSFDFYKSRGSWVSPALGGETVDDSTVLYYFISQLIQGATIQVDLFCPVNFSLSSGHYYLSSPSGPSFLSRLVFVNKESPANIGIHQPILTTIIQAT